MEDISVLYYNNKSKTTIYGDSYNLIKKLGQLLIQSSRLQAAVGCCSLPPQQRQPARSYDLFP